MYNQDGENGKVFVSIFMALAATNKDNLKHFVAALRSEWLLVSLISLQLGGQLSKHPIFNNSTGN